MSVVLVVEAGHSPACACTRTSAEWLHFGHSKAGGVIASRNIAWDPSHKGDVLRAGDALVARDRDGHAAVARCEGQAGHAQHAAPPRR